MNLSRNVMIDKLFELIRDGQHVVSIKLTGGFPPHTANYELIDGTGGFAFCGHQMASSGVT